MREIDIEAFRKEVVAVIEDNRDKVTSFEAAEDYSIFTFCGKNYACEVTIKNDWIGYDLGIDTPDGMPGCGMQEDTDIYPLKDGNEEITLRIYDELLATVKALFAGKVYYTCNEEYSYTAIQNDDDTYRVRYWERKKLLFWPYASGWRKDNYSEVEFKKLRLNVLS
jgi:hypothetical protein